MPTKEEERTRRLMERIHANWNGVIQAECRLSSVPAAFVAALIGNEGGLWILRGVPVPSRFEPHVFKALKDVQKGRRKSYGGIVQKHLDDQDDGGLRCLSSSWGITQIMGYNAVLRGVDPLELRVKPQLAIHLTLRMLAECCESNGLDPREDFEGMLRWWNSGSVNGKTYHPDYVPNGLAYAAIYQTLTDTDERGKL